MRRDSWLDRMVYSFQHRWETNSQYRAAVSGVVGLVLLVAMCSCSGIVSAMANTTLAGMGFGASGSAGQGNGSPNTGTNRIAGAKEFAIPTQVWTPGVVPPASPLPNSLTPAPTATPVPTATDTPTPLPCTSNCGGGVGGGYSVKVTATISPNPMVGLKQATISIHTSVGTDGVGFLVQGTATQTYEPAGTTDANGNFSMSFQAPTCSGSVTILVFADGAAAPGTPGYSFNPPCN